jgi:HEPN domain-containing protein
MNEKAKKLAKEWFEAAESDLKYAEVGLKEGDVFPQITFLCQQSAEKFLKGFLVLNGVEPPRIHELPKLLDESVKIQAGLEEIRDVCELLVGFYIESRYPPNIPNYSKGDLENALENAQLVRETVRKYSSYP